jgi:hypothetical protein
LLDRKESHGYTVDDRTKGLKPKKEMVLQLAMTLGLQTGALHSTFQAAGCTFGETQLSPTLNAAPSEAFTWALTVCDKQWIMADGRFQTQDLHKCCIPENMVRENIWRVHPESSTASAGTHPNLSNRLGFHFAQINTGVTAEETQVVPMDIMEELEYSHQRNVTVVPWNMLVIQGCCTQCTLPDDLSAPPAIPDTHMIEGVLAIRIRTESSWPYDMACKCTLGSTLLRTFPYFGATRPTDGCTMGCLQG